MRVTPLRTEIIIKATRTQDVLGEKGQRIRELTSVIQKRLGSNEHVCILNVSVVKHSVLTCFVFGSFCVKHHLSQIQLP